ncbi:M15 family metallopeptidase [Cellulosimicrobium cellulans]|uniref:M15 family metallopeptidase n=1 Tax=Cellulosimicrobium cellulans TaxID=1710 RepID=UPI001BA8DC51|nr:M15 family metallopeptidase [Cellulosimicrobium cellulans]QUC01241.1 M15 family metallopeptidase [Cellulosimicrobium cellulans]
MSGTAKTADSSHSITRRQAIQSAGFVGLLAAFGLSPSGTAHAWGGYSNGQIPDSALAALSIGGRLRPDAAAALERLRPAFEAGTGVRLAATDTYRPYEIQRQLFLSRYQPQASGNGPFGDVRVWNGVRYVRVQGPAAAVPGTSNHGWGLAVDFAAGINSSFTSATYLWMKANAGAYGWSNATGRVIDEPWHWEFQGGDTNEENELLADEREALFQIRDYLGARGGLNTLTPDSVGYKVNDIQQALTRDLPKILAALAAVPAEVWATAVQRPTGPVAALQELADAKTAALAIKAKVGA